MRQALYSQTTSHVILFLVTISHATLAAPLRFVNDMNDLISRGNGYLAFPFRLVLPEERDDQLGQVQLSIDNIDRRIVEAVRTLTSPPTVTVEVVLAASPDSVEAGPFNFTLRDADYDVLVVTGTLMYEDVLNEPWPADVFSPQFFPALFR